MVQALAFFVLSTVASAAISFLFPSEGPRMKDLSISCSTYGNVIPRVWGVARVGGNMIWAQPIKEVKKKKKAGLGSFYNEYTYFGTFAMAWCEGPAQSVRKVWANGKLVYDETGSSQYRSNGKYKMRLYRGTEDQLTDPAIESTLGAAQTTAFRGLCLCVFEDYALADSGNQIPQFAAEVYVGANNLIPVSPITEITGPENVIGGYAYGRMAFDSERGYFYAGGWIGIHRYNLVSSIEDRQILADDMALPPGGGFNGDILGVMEDGSVIIGINDPNGFYAGTQGIALLDPNTYVVMSYVMGVPAVFAHAIDVLGQSIMTLSFFGTVGWIDYSSGILLYSGFSTQLLTAGTQNSGYALCTGEAPGVFYAVWNAINLNPLGVQEFYISRLTAQPGFAPIVDLIYTYVSPYPSSIIVVGRSVWDAGQPGIIIEFLAAGATGWNLLKFDPNTASVVWEILGTPPFSSWGYLGTKITNGELAWLGPGAGSNDVLYVVDTTNGSYVNREPDIGVELPWTEKLISDLIATNPGASGYSLTSNVGVVYQYYDGQRGIIVSLGGSPYFANLIKVGAYTSLSVTLEFIVEDLLRLAGLTSADFELSSLGSVNVRGYGFAKTTDIKNVLDELRQVFLFDLIETGGKLVAILRGVNTSAETINYLALGNLSGADSDKADFWKETRVSEADIPAQINMSYMNIDNDFQTSTASSSRITNPRPTMYSRQVVKFEASIVFNADEAKSRTQTMLAVQWNERTKHETKLPLAYSYLDPSDVITVTLPSGRNYVERIDKMEIGADYSIDTGTIGQDSGAYIQDQTGDGGSHGGPDFTQTVDPPTSAKMFVFNTPYLRDIDAGGDASYSIYYIGAGNQTAASAFHGAGFYESLDNSTYNLINTSSNSVDWGGVVGIVPPPSHGVFGMDWETQITIWPSVAGFTLESITDAELWEWGNLCAIGSEVLQFRDAVENANGSWTIWNLLRGRRGTEWASDNHVIGEYFVFFDVDTILIEHESIDVDGHVRWFKAVGTGKNVATTLPVKITYAVRDLMPYAPAQLAAAWSSADLHITFERRTRYGGNMQDGTAVVPLHETTEGYEVDIFDITGTTVIRTIALDNGVSPVANPVVVYDATMIATDWATLPTELTIEVFQMGFVGRGFGTKETLLLAGSPAFTTRYWGASANTSLTSGQVQALGSSDLHPDFNLTTTYNCTGGQYPYFAFPASYGTPSHVIVNGLPFSSFTVTTQTVAGASFHVLRFINLQHGSSIPVIWA